MSQAHIAHDGTGYRVYLTETGRDRRYHGPSWKTPREAARYADLISVPYVDPLRASGEAIPANTVPPHGAVYGRSPHLSPGDGAPGASRP